MLSWLCENAATIIICAVLAAVVAALIVNMVKNRKKGKSSCGCGCSSCPMSVSCCNSGVGKADKVKNERGNSDK